MRLMRLHRPMKYLTVHRFIFKYARIYTILGERMKKHKLVWGIVIGVCTLAVITMMSVYAQTQTEYLPLKGVQIVVDPGHGGKDDGARAEGIKEQEINLAISIKLKTALEKQGATVLLTRDGAYDLASEGATNRKREDMKKRVAIINDQDVDLFISVHLNSYPNTSIHGAHAFYQKNDLASQTLADIIQKQFNAITGDEKSSKTGDYYILNNTKKPGVLIECGFLSNSEDRAKLNDPSYQETLAKGLTNSVLEFLNVLNF